MTNDRPCAGKTQSAPSGEYVFNVKGTYCNSVQVYFCQLGIALKSPNFSSLLKKKNQEIPILM